MSEFNSKQLGRNKHTRHKQQKDKHSKFKHKTVQNVHPTRVVLESNFCFYDEVSSDESSSAPDFEEVLRSSANVGTHFQFRDEKESNEKEISLFKIDGQLLASALSTIPFHERLDIDSSYFTAEELEDQEQIATENEDKYRQMCENRSREIIMKGKNYKRLPEIQQQQRPVRFTEDTETDSTRDDLDEILEGTRSFHIVVEPVLKIKATSENSAVVSTVDHESKESMQKWLDDLLS